MNSSTVLTVLVALVVLLAGCGGAAVSEDGGDGAAGGSDGSDGDSASGSGGDAGSSGSGDDSADQSFAVTDSEQALRDAGSFTATWTFTMTDANGTEATMSSAYVVDLDTERSHESFSIDGEAEAVEFETFYADGMAYTKLGDGEQSFFQVRPDDTDLVENALARAITGYDEFDDAQFTGTESFDGDTVDRFVYSDPAVWQQYGTGTFGTEQNVTVTDFTVVVLVDQNGLARSTEWTVNGETEAGETVSAGWRYTVTDVGTTSVEDPDWLDAARAQSQG
ncbi:hypothetical protein ACFQJ5_07080 [Halomicroarcula sp. GCM10025324]|uniref:DUF7537 family lipoprotein n=1 Tax=Haloarcula TaxID=2237 RepID=UPI0023E7E952|nr:hypothetical protein [Halomicroarcula sp. ZS-22-S1]